MDHITASPARRTLRRTFARRWLLLAAAVIALPLAIACGDDDDDPTNTESITIGALFDFSGDWETLGKTSEVALELAVDYINDQPDSEGFPEVEYEIVDTGLDPDRALEAIEKFHDDGIRIVIGPQSSSEAAAVKEFADANGMIVISQGSTASSLAVGDDNVFRLTPVDKRAVDALIPLLEEDGVTSIVPIWRADVGNQGYAAAMKEKFPAAGGEVSEGVEYAANDPDFETALDELEEQLDAAGDDAAVYLAAFGEVSGLFAAAAERPGLADRAWYGTDGVVRTESLIADETAASFAEEVGYPSPIFGLDHSAEGETKWRAVFDAIQDESGIEPDAFALAVYDGVFLIVKAVQRAGTLEAEALGEALVAEAAAMEGITGAMAFDEAGDRDNAAFDFWSVCVSGGDPRWVLALAYVPSGEGGTITRLEGCG